MNAVGVIVESKALTYEVVGRSHIDLLARLNAELIVGEGCPLKMTHEQLSARMAHWLENGISGHICYLGEDVVAYALYFEDEEQLFIRHFLVREQWRRRGIGRQFLAFLCREVWPNKPIVAEALSKNPAAIAFWQTQGFEAYYVGFQRPQRAAAA